MDQHLEQMFLIEIDYQCRLAILAYEDLLKAVPGDTVRCWSSIQSILISTGNISKILWPPKPLDRDPALEAEYKRRGKILCKKLSVDDTSVLNSRGLRNHFEHVDARLHEWAKKSRHRNLSYRNIIPLGHINVGTDPRDYMYNLDPETLMVTFWSNNFDIHTIIRTIRQLQNELKNIADFKIF
jgi:hypothetical protein